LPQSLNQRDESAYHLGLLTARNQKNDPANLPNYVYEPSLGKDQTIYVFDGGYRKSHVEFDDKADREVREIIVPNPYTLGPIQPPIDPNIWAPEDETDYDGHGTMVASVAAGNSNGMASLANLVVVKFKNAAKNPNNPSNKNFLKRGVMDSALEFAFMKVLSDVAEKKAYKLRSKQEVYYQSFIW
jgi:subtilisin family serine protease